MSTNPVNLQLLQILNSSTINNIQDVIDTMNAIDGALPSSDGLKWFNLLYLMVTREVLNSPPSTSWQNPLWIARLDLVFAEFYFDAIKNFISNTYPTPGSWEALFEARFRFGIERIQFAFAGMNAHINHDLSLALLQTDSEFNITPAKGSPEHNDYEHVNNLLEAVLPSALEMLAAGGPIGEIAEDIGKVGKLLAIWNVRQARDLAWDFADHLRDLSGVHRQIALLAQDKLTGVIGRTLLLPL